MKLFFIILSFFALSVLASDNIDITAEEHQAWKDFKLKYERNYPSKEEITRKEIFVKNRRLIEEHNERYNRREVSYFMKVNKFADWTPEEINKLYGKFKLWFAPSMVPSDIMKQDK